jgi:hypothetical protein
MNIAFKYYLGVFMKQFLDDFSVFNNLDTHLLKHDYALINAWNSV